MTQAISALQAAVDKFWEDNPALKSRILQDLYCHGHVSLYTTELGVKAVDVWLAPEEIRGRRAGQ